MNQLALIDRVFLAFVATTERNPIMADVIDALIA